MQVLTSGGRAVEHNNNFDLIRLLAACQVASMHAGEWLKLPFSPKAHFLWLFPGVPVFFIVSGFLITGSFCFSGKDTRGYFRSRFLRIYPGLWGNLLVIFLMLVGAGVLSWAWLINPRPYIYFSILAATGSTYFAHFIAGDAGLNWNSTLPFFPGGVLWTITVELGFYLLIPLVFKTKRKWMSLSVWFCGSLIIAIAQNYYRSAFLDTIILPYLWIFLLGAATRLAWNKIKWAFENTFHLWLTAHLLLWVIPDYKNISLMVVISTLSLAGCTLSFAHTLPRLAACLRGNDLSYGIYLYHMPIVMVLMNLGQMDAPTGWCLTYFCVFIAAALSWFGIERPYLAFKAPSATKIISGSLSSEAQKSISLSPIRSLSANETSPS